jgi:hypothetical protein
MSKPDSIKVDDHASAPCPYCGGTYTIIMHDDTGSVLHSLPACAVYIETDPMSFVVMARKRLEKLGLM